MPLHYPSSVTKDNLKAVAEDEKKKDENWTGRLQWTCPPLRGSSMVDAFAKEELLLAMKLMFETAWSTMETVGQGRESGLGGGAGAGGGKEGLEGAGVNPRPRPATSGNASLDLTAEASMCPSHHHSENHPAIPWAAGAGPDGPPQHNYPGLGGGLLVWAYRTCGLVVQERPSGMRMQDPNMNQAQL
ncbi:cat eye syndrome critical region protein 2 [Lates japonicus]|uniref:Cat eye syndrome critical region protein 2 n=1 Tax=Lates japonicus TaxID=270547 RepID=A0AAD3MVQ7_LATJO|nr:cat eye syndrome critical region protein 2 [Lates japonicus]